jgi:hypothetical protein
MILKFVVLIGLAIYFAVVGQWLYCLWAVLCIIPVLGLWLAIALSIVLVVNGFYASGAILIILISINLIGNEILKKGRRKAYLDTSDIRINLVRYCREYFIEICSFFEEDADLAVLDPLLGEEMDKVKSKWAFALTARGIDPDAPLINFDYRLDGMDMINKVLYEYSKKYKDRKKTIIQYLKSIGHPKGIGY